MVPWRALPGMVALAAALSGCASMALTRLQPGSPAEQVQAQAGLPTSQRTLPDGTRAWYYEKGPNGWTTYRVRFDGDNRVLDVEQVLTERHFRTLVPNKTTRDDLLLMFGRPALVTRYPNLGEETWTYRYMDVTLEMLNDDHFDMATGLLKYYTLYRDPAYTSQGGHR